MISAKVSVSSVEKWQDAMTQKPYGDSDLADVSDHPAWTDEQLAAAKPFSTVFPGAAASIQREQDPQNVSTKVKVSPDVVTGTR